MKKDKLTTLLLGLGIGLVALSVAALVISMVAQQQRAKEARALVSQLRQLMPPVQSAGPDDRVNTVMPSMEVQGANFCGVLEIPTYNADLPIGARWDTGKLSGYPCRFTGSIYDGSLIIGGSDSKGQLDFVQEITGGDRLYLTDMTGNRYRLQVVDAYRTKDVSAEHLMAQDADLVLFARNTYSLDYTLVMCKFG